MKKQLAFAFAMCVAGLGASAQNNQRIVAGNTGMYPAYVSFAEGAEPDFIPGTVLLQEADAFVPSTATVLLHSEPDQIGQEHFRYQQKINNIPVEGAVYVMHVSGGKVKSMNGEWIAATPDKLPTVAVLREDDALQSAMAEFGAKSYKWQIPAEEAFIKAERGNADATFRPKGELVYYSGEQKISGETLRLAWKLDVYAQEPIGRRIYFVDAETGSILGKRDLIHHTNATGTAVTGYSGSQTIIADQTSASSFRLRETGRGNGIATYNLAQGTTYGYATDFTDADNYWNNTNSTFDQYAADAHWGAEKTYDYYKNTYGRSSIDNAGYAINSYVHYSTNYFNAFWDGSRMTYGDGGVISNNQPLTSIDVCGHEITHGLTAFTAALNYSYESGALNEGFSDIFGTTIEYYASPTTANWQLGEAFYALRDMSHPGDFGQPTTYQGMNWMAGTSDNGGVHTNSGVLNFWYYLLTVGGSGTNDNSYSYSVSGIGMNKAAAIAYRTLTVYLTSTSQYSHARTYSIQAATDLYGASSNEVTQVIAAWNAVGVAGSPATTTPPNTPTTPTSPTCSDIYESNETRGAAKTIAVNTNITARIGAAADKDWFVFTTTNAAPKLKVTLSNLPKDYDLRLYKSNGTQIGISQNGGTTSESISYNSSSVGATYYVQVYGYNSAYTTANCYTMRATTSNVNQLVESGSSNQNNGLLKSEGTLTSDGAMSVFPNPAKDKLTVRFSSEMAGVSHVSISDLMGRVVLNQEVSLQEGSSDITLPLVNYTPGIYFLHTGGQAVRFQIVE